MIGSEKKVRMEVNVLPKQLESTPPTELWVWTYNEIDNDDNNIRLHAQNDKNEDE
jgi:hypothetical protein